MSVIVNGMKMPNSCISCPLLEYDEFAIDGYKDHWCNALDIGMSIDEMPEGRREDCPLTELILCKDCKSYKADEYEADYGDCTNDTGMCNAFVYGNDYCSQAERKRCRMKKLEVRINPFDIVVAVCHPKVAEECQIPKEAVVSADFLPEDQCVVVKKKEFLAWLYEDALEPENMHTAEPEYDEIPTTYGTCPNCGADVYSSQKFCDQCGQHLKWK